MTSRLYYLFSTVVIFLQVSRTVSLSPINKLDIPRSSLSLARMNFFLATSPVPLLDDQLVVSEESNMGIRKSFKWDNELDKFVPQPLTSYSKFDPQPQSAFQYFLRTCFLPSGKMSPDYVKYTQWRMMQRFLSATTSVFGTQALLLAIGVKQSKIGIAAATTWVLKDALGKISRIFWASRHAKKFDSDAKKWRYRSSILFAAGSALEIFTYIFPSFFLLIAALANALKQMAMLTSSATRNAIYKSFARNADNIGDITAKGEAQIAVIDLIGMFTGIIISRLVGASREKIGIVFCLFSALDLYCIFNEIKR